MNLPAILAIYRFEMARTRRTILQSIISPVISTSLYFVVFGAAIGSRIEQIDGISFGLKDPTAAENQARQLAVRNLQAKAQLYAQSLNVQLSGIRNLTEGGGYTPQPPMPMVTTGISAALMSR